MDIEHNFSDRPSFVHQKEYCELLTPLTKMLDINCFTHMRVMSTGHAATLSTNPYLTADLYVNNCPFPLMSKEGVIAPSGMYHYSKFQEPTFKKGWDLLASKYAFANILFIVQNYGSYADIFMMGSDPENTNTVSNYLNSINDMQKFLNIYMPQSEALLQQELAIAIDLSNCLNDFSTTNIIESSHSIKEFLINTKNVILSHHSTNHAITLRELQCLYYLSHGDGYKTIGNKLNISPRTVEAHIEHMKNKTKCNTRKELISLFWVCEINSA